MPNIYRGRGLLQFENVVCARRCDEMQHLGACEVAAVCMCLHPQLYVCTERVRRRANGKYEFYFLNINLFVISHFRIPLIFCHPLTLVALLVFLPLPPPTSPGLVPEQEDEG